MKEELYSAIKGNVIASITLGIIVMVTGIVSGTLMIISGAKLLARRKEMII